LRRTRLPRLKKAYENAAIYTFWLSPDAFAQALPVLASVPTNTEGKPESRSTGTPYFSRLTWRNFALAFGALAILVAAQVGVTRAWSPNIYPASLAQIQLVIPNRSPLAYSAERFVEKYAQQPDRLLLLDGEDVLFERPYPFSEKDRSNPLVVEFPARLGDHTLTLRLVSDSARMDTLNLYNRKITLTPGQVWIIMYDSIPRPK
jgi:hypothetical protein